jgi:hypothetical protein
MKGSRRGEVPQWVSIVLPVVTLVVGALLTMAGQALSDRRREASERLARKQEFQNSNFEVHRTALLEMQEILRDSFIAAGAERHRRTYEGYYKFFDARPLKRYTEALPPLDEVEALMSSAVDDALPEDKRQTSQASLREMMEFITFVATETKSMVEAVNEHFQSKFPFMDQLVQFMYRLRLTMYRSGSNSVVYCGERYIKALAKWDKHLVSRGEDDLFKELQASQYELNRAISNALKSGPYDKYEPWNEKNTASTRQYESPREAP